MDGGGEDDGDASGDNGSGGEGSGGDVTDVCLCPTLAPIGIAMGRVNPPGFVGTGKSGARWLEGTRCGI